MPHNDEQKFRNMMEDYAARESLNRITKAVFIAAGVALIVALVACGVW